MGKHRGHLAFCAHSASVSLLDCPSSELQHQHRHAGRQYKFHFQCQAVWQAAARGCLASLTGSMQALLNKHDGKVPKFTIATSPEGPLYSYEQAVAEHLYNFHLQRNQVFPRPCPHCKEWEFFKQQSDTPSVVQFATRPWQCDQCQRWFHLGCLGVKHIDDVPAKPWFHCKQCKDMFIRLEATAEGGLLPSATSLDHTWCLLTDTDHRNFLGGRRPRGDVEAVYNILLGAFAPHVVEGYGDPAREWDGGKHAMVLYHRNTPVSALTFNVFGNQLAQLNLLATVEQQRRHGHGRVLLETFEEYLSAQGVKHLVTQPRQKDVDLWVKRFGYRVLHPEDTLDLHMEVPVAYYDSAVLHKQLRQLPASLLRYYLQVS